MPRLNRSMYGFSPMVGAQRVNWTPSNAYFNRATPSYYTLAGGLTLTETKTGSIIARVNPSATGGANTVDIFSSSSSRFWFELYSSGTDEWRFAVNAKLNTTVGTTGMQMLSDADVAVPDNWYTVLMSWDTTPGDYSKYHLYVNNAQSRSVTSQQVNNTEVLRYSTDDLQVGSTTGGSSPFGGCLHALAFSTAYVDWSVQANRDKVMVNPEGGDYRLKYPGQYATNWLGGNNAEMLFVDPYDNFVNTGSGGDVFTEVNAVEVCTK